MKLTVVGCTGSMSGPKGAASSYLVQTDTTTILLDMGPGSMGQLMNYIDPAELDAILLSHLHTDHVADIIGMQVYRKWFPTGPLGPIDVYSPGDGLERTRQIGGDAPEETYAGEFTFHAVTEGDKVKVGDVEIEFFHAEHPVPAHAMRLTGPAGQVLTYSGDTDYCEGQVEAARGADMYLCEAAFEAERDTVRGIHLTGARAGQIATKAGVKNLVLTHLQPWTDPDVVCQETRQTYEGPIAVATPGVTFHVANSPKLEA
ncbi:MBL fold metallo-hydrolase [Flaviflexus massiliensis]|uniref:MBL fold metallo-hydrolase n=1 Tax=Flaviflexus massiliensis TaxID=1522309 RepID=UPI0006D561A1|nr:MBL fold metallo-hydrolase [Flaviflexus massiliensis]